jgi:hypothetical protein
MRIATLGVMGVLIIAVFFTLLNLKHGKTSNRDPIGLSISSTSADLAVSDYTLDPEIGSGPLINVRVKGPDDRSVHIFADQIIVQKMSSNRAHLIIPFSMSLDTYQDAIGVGFEDVTLDIYVSGIGSAEIKWPLPKGLLKGHLPRKNGWIIITESVVLTNSPFVVGDRIFLTVKRRMDKDTTEPEPIKGTHLVPVSH